MTPDEILGKVWKLEEERPGDHRFLAKSITKNGMLVAVLDNGSTEELFPEFWDCFAQCSEAETLDFMLRLGHKS